MEADEVGGLAGPGSFPSADADADAAVAGSSAGAGGAGSSVSGEGGLGPPVSSRAATISSRGVLDAVL